VQISQLIQQGKIWQARGNQRAYERPCLATKIPALNQVLPDGGWPLGHLTEILYPFEHSCGLSLLMGNLAALSESGWVWLINPPFVPFAASWQQWDVDMQRLLWLTPQSDQEALWAAEQVLASKHCAAALIWSKSIKPPQTRRLQLAVKKSQSLSVLFRPESAKAQASSAVLRLRAQPQYNSMGLVHLHVEVLKARGAINQPNIEFTLPEFSSHPLQHLEQAFQSQPLANVVPFRRAD
jgi:protein ImuA